MKRDIENLKYWADLGDNRIGPILLQLVDAIQDSDDTDTLRKLANRLKFMSGSIHSFIFIVEHE
jgi:hypothetical protein